MKHAELTIAEIGLIAGTRAALGGGIALLLSDRLTAEQRRAVGWTLVAVGAITTLPLLAQVWWSRRDIDDSDDSHPASRGTRSYFRHPGA